MNRSPATENLLRIDERLSAIDWAILEHIESVDLGANDCLVVGAGFEDRALTALTTAARSSRSFHVALVTYLPKIDQNKESECLKICESQDIQVGIVEYDREHPSGIGPKLAEYVGPFGRVFLDISGMSRLLIVQLIVALIDANISFHVLYTEAAVYPPLEEDFKRAHKEGGASPSFISSGIFEIVSTPELSTAAMLGGPIRLISFPSFDPIQLSNLVQEVQPTHNNVIHGLPPNNALTWRREAIQESNRSTIDSLQRVEIHEISTLDYRESLHLILKLYREHSVFDRILIAPTGSKMQAVAVGILRGVLSDLQIVYPTPLEFVDPEHYTDGVRQTYQLSIPTDKLAGLRKQVSIDTNQ